MGMSGLSVKSDQSPILFVSTPRSGLHFLSMSLESLSLKKTLFCEGYTCTNSFREIVENCPAQNEVLREVCHMKRPIIKNHDFKLDLSLEKYREIFVFRRRDSYSSLISWFELCLKEGFESVIDSKQGFEEFVAKKLLYYVRFNAKYDLCGLDSTSYIYYEDFYHPDFLQGCIKKIYHVLEHELTPFDLIKIRRLQIRPKREPKYFRYYSRDMHAYVNNFIDLGLATENAIGDFNDMFQDKLTQERE